MRRLGQEAYDRLVEPIVGGIFTADGTKLSMQAAMPQFVAMEREQGGLIRGYRKPCVVPARAYNKGMRAGSGARYNQFVAPLQGMQSWIDAIVSKLSRVDFRMGRSVVRLCRNGNEWHIDDDSGNRHRSDAIVVALPTHQAGPLSKRRFRNSRGDSKGSNMRLPSWLPWWSIVAKFLSRIAASA